MDPLAFSSVWAVLLTGALAGSLHVLSGPDHLLAIVPFGLEAGESSWLVGFRWGVGHSVGLAMVGGIAFFARDQLDLEPYEEIGELLGAVVLIGIGVWGLLRFRRATDEATAGLNDHHHSIDCSHSHGHAGGGQATVAIGVGALHGLIGTGALGILPVLGMSDWSRALAYLSGVILGALGVMTCFGWLVGRFSVRTRAAGSEQRIGRVYRTLYSLACWGVVGMGLLWITRALLTGHAGH